MYEEYELQTTETDREIMLHRMYDEIHEDVCTYDEMVDKGIEYYGQK